MRRTRLLSRNIYGAKYGFIEKRSGGDKKCKCLLWTFVFKTNFHEYIAKITSPFGGFKLTNVINFFFIKLAT